MTPDDALRAECINLAEWFYRMQPNEDEAVTRLRHFATQQQVNGIRRLQDALRGSHAPGWLDAWCDAQAKEEEG